MPAFSPITGAWKANILEREISEGVKSKSCKIATIKPMKIEFHCCKNFLLTNPKEGRSQFLIFLIE